MKKYNKPSIVTYFEPNAIMPLAAVGSAVASAVSSSSAALTGGVAAGVSLGMMAGRRDIYRGKRNTMIPCCE